MEARPRIPCRVQPCATRRAGLPTGVAISEYLGLFRRELDKGEMVPKARSVIYGVRNGKTAQQAARDIGVSADELRQWRRDPAFRAALRRKPGVPKVIDLNSIGSAPTQLTAADLSPVHQDLLGRIPAKVRGSQSSRIVFSVTRSGSKFPTPCDRDYVLNRHAEVSRICAVDPSAGRWIELFYRWTLTAIDSEQPSAALRSPLSASPLSPSKSDARSRRSTGPPRNGRHGSTRRNARSANPHPNTTRGRD